MMFADTYELVAIAVAFSTPFAATTHHGRSRCDFQLASRNRSDIKLCIKSFICAACKHVSTQVYLCIKLLKLGTGLTLMPSSPDCFANCRRLGRMRLNPPILRHNSMCYSQSYFQSLIFIDKPQVWQTDCIAQENIDRY